jgi:lipoyl(octanoyl) transferase
MAADWRLILGAGDRTRLRGASGARNMAVDHALLEAVQAGGRPVLRLYCWQPACLSLGRNQRALGVYDPAAAAARGIDIVRRPTGGLAVLHDSEVTYCVLAPVALLGGPRTAYEAINHALVAALRTLGVGAELAGGAAPRSPVADTAEPCFQAPGAGEVTASGRKLVGSAQRCEGRALLQHGSLLLGGSQDAVRALLVARPGPLHGSRESRAPGDHSAQPDPLPEPVTDPGSTTLHDLLGRRLPVDELVQPLVHAFADVFGTRLAPDTLTREERARADALEARYDDAAWTWRR